MIKIYPYKQGSASVKALKQALDAKIIKLENSRYRYKPAHKVINWGNSRRPSWMSNDVPVINKPEDVAIASNKLLTLEKLEGEGVATVPFTVNEDTAQEWLDDGHKVFVRQTLTGHSGAGIIVQESGADAFLLETARSLALNGFHRQSRTLYDDARVDVPEIEPAPLYTMGINNHGEYRVHVFNGEVILYQKKSRRVNEETGEVVTAEGEEADVRNLASNWVYRTGNLNRLERIEELAKNAVRALGLDFGAVDIIKDENGEVFVLEVNCAPGLKNQETLQAYVNAISNHD